MPKVSGTGDKIKLRSQQSVALNDTTPTLPKFAAQPLLQMDEDVEELPSASHRISIAFEQRLGLLRSSGNKLELRRERNDDATLRDAKLVLAPTSHVGFFFFRNFCRSCSR